ncbi:hypothetical protein NIA71_19735 [Ihubacter massiliensis]|uniref:hypothetical protein n=1 Tax=Ihubacter massiliensis TaxID=1852367 RepID=UPI002096EB8D|nr:hypothetical protein [Ihubacter massiliensis]MCO7124153.1 hypothetical protein [Ihubacter massiliensis]
MKNREKYKDEIMQSIKSRQSSKICRLIKENSGGDCEEINCTVCINFLYPLWLEEEYKEPETDWSKVAVDTPVLVKNAECAGWVKRHFAKYEDGQVYAFDLGCTSWTNSRHATSWNYAKLAELEEAE